MSHVSKLPSSFNGPQSPMLTSDSPFPLFKSDYRYKGVYERAGFDVNLNRRQNGGTGSPSDTRTMALARKKPESPASQTFSFKSALSSSQQGVNHSLRSLPMSARPQNVSPTESRSSSSRAVPQTNSAPYKPASPVNQYNSPAPASAPASAHPDNAPVNFQASRKPPRNPSLQQGYPEFQTFQPFKPETDRQVVLDEQGNACSVGDAPRSDRNIKNLCLHIPDSTHNDNTDFSKPDAEFHSNLPSGMGSESDINSPTFDNAERVSTAHTSTTSSREFRKNSADSGMSVKTSELVRNTPYPTLNQIPVIQEHQDLSTMLELFRLDVEEHKKYDPRRKMSRSATKLPDNASLFTPDTTNHSMRLDDCYSSESSFNFTNENMAPAEPQKAQEGLDYQNFLETSAAGDRKLARNSNLSTISSIISKLNDGDDEARDDEVDPELHRQLESLKAGSQIEESPAFRPIDNDSFVTASNLPEHANNPAPVPVFKIQDVSTAEEEQPTEASSPITEKQRVSSGTSSNPFFEGEEGADEFQPKPAVQEPVEEDLDLNDEPEEQFEKKAPTTPYTVGGEFEDPYFQGTPETIKPLSPKNHKIEQELKDMNFKYALDVQDLESPVIPPRAIHHEADDAILLQNRPPAEFNPFPQSVIGSQYPKFRDSDLPMKTPPGQGRCRGCGEDVEKCAKGPRKAIFSKTGELSGQWHRGCFSCSYTGCDVKFNKHTACYVLLDNAFCNHHYHLLNGTLCQSCNSGIEGECIENEMRQKWHLDCLKCNKCHTHIKDDYFLINGEVVCENDASNLITKMENEGMLSTDKIEKRRTRMMFVDQVAEF